MPCPHFRKNDNECGLLDNLPADPDEDVGQPEPDRIPLHLCLSTNEDWRGCAIFRRRLVEAKSAY
jgi:hypothetical protein